MGEAEAADQSDTPASSPLDAWLPSLRWLLHGLLGREITLVAAPGHGSDGQLAPRRPVLDPARLLLPHDPRVQGAHGFRLARAAVAHAVAHLRFSAPARALGRLKPMSVAVISALEDVRVERLLVRELPGIRAWFAEGIAHTVQEEVPSFAGLIGRLDRVLVEPERRDGHYWVEKARTLFEAQAELDLHDYDAFRRIASVLANDLGQLRVPFRAQGYVVPGGYRDDNTYLWQLPDPEQPPVPFNFTGSDWRRDDATEPARPDGQDMPESEELELGRFCYPEWDARAGVARRDWTTVIEKRPSWHASHAMQPVAVRTALILRPSRRLVPSRQRRSYEGEHLNLSAAVDSAIAWRTGRTPDARIFFSGQSISGHASLLVLLDLSQSTADAVSPGGPSLLALECRAAVLLASAAAQGSAQDRVAIHGFHSDGRERVSYYRMLDFGAPLDAAAESRVTQAPARYSTRMGAALRHASRCLAREDSARRALLLVTDGAPSDIDVHRPEYLVEDAREAVFSARRAGVRVYGLAVDPSADGYMRRIFGVQDCELLEHPEQLVTRLRHAYVRMARA